MNHAIAIVDLRIPSGLPPHSAAANQLKNLRPGEVYELITDIEPTRMMRACELELADVLRWDVISQGPPVWRLRVSQTRETPTPEVEVVLERDHLRLEGLLKGCLASLEDNDTHSAAVLLHEFASGVRRHIRAESDVVGPLLLDGTTDSDLVAQRMLHQHSELLNRIGAIEAWLEQGALTSERARQLSPLRDLLAEHERYEREQLGPAWARVLASFQSPEEQQRLYLRIASVLEGRR